LVGNVRGGVVVLGHAGVAQHKRHYIADLGQNTAAVAVAVAAAV